MLIGTGRREAIVDRVGHDAALSLGRECGGHRGAEHVHGSDDRGIDIVLDRIDIGRKEDASAAAPHLMDVVHDLRVPSVVGPEDGVLRLLLRERVPIPVVVVTDVVVVEPRKGGSLVLRAEPLVIPIRHPLRPVRIQGRNVQQDDVVQNFANSFLIRRRQTV